MTANPTACRPGAPARSVRRIVGIATIGAALAGLTPSVRGQDGPAAGERMAPLRTAPTVAWAATAGKIEKENK